MSIPSIPYLSGGRERCVTGSCILTAASDLLGRSIRMFEGHDAWCSHAAGVVRFPETLVARERVTLIESLEHGPTPTYLSHYFSGFVGRLFLFTPAGLTETVQTAFSAWLFEQVCNQVAYDYAALGKQIFGHVHEDGKALFCSELVGMGWEAAGLSRLPSAPKGVAPQPSDIASWWDGEVIELVGPFAEEE